VGGKHKVIDVLIRALTPHAEGFVPDDLRAVNDDLCMVLVG
jgi:hypothetical protein